ncbi:phage tail protein [Rathayibacter soli]|uniref:phage tail protein n=1 Tax=Rathayibacter soli TaxID=3144168 RepID=UPI0027E5151B|nr:tail fiber protein [Glaciibacter superstes]
MSQPFIGEVRIFAGNFAPLGWSFCDGSILSIAQNVALFSLIGTTYGGDGQNTFALPDLRGRFAVHAGTGGGGTTSVIGQASGAESVTLATSQLPSHTHVPQSSSAAATTATAAGGAWAAWSDSPYAAAAAPTVAMSPAAVASAGGGQPHDNMPPFTAVNFIIALFGVFPTQN